MVRWRGIRARGTQDPAGRWPGFRWHGIPVYQFVFNAVLLGLLVAAGGVAIVKIRARWLRSGDDRGDWERTLVTYKNLRDEGVLSEEEFRKIRTLVEPRLRSDGLHSVARRPSAGGRLDSDHERI